MKVAWIRFPENLVGTDNQRLFLFIALSFVTLLLWEAWQKDYGPATAVSPDTAAETEQAATTIADLPEMPPPGH